MASFNLKDIFLRFGTNSTFLTGEACGSGHIHDTFRIVTAEGNNDDYLLQRINDNVFRNVPHLQENIERVTQHIRNKLSEIPGSDLKRECLQLVFTKEGKSWINYEGNFWRMFLYIPNHKSYNTIDNIQLAREGGKAIGRFQSMLADMPGDTLHETIPWFHNIEKRLEAFHKVLADNPCNRVASIPEVIDSYQSRSEEMKTILKLGREGLIPLRITHNDTKFNNILLDENDKALCVIDLDTVMPGFIHYDFGDAIRTGANRAPEDETKLEKVGIDMELFDSYAEGYLSQTAKTLTPEEIEYLAFSPKLMTYIIGLRFLTDYIDGDKYYKIHHESHNLDRARSQLALLKSMEKEYDEMRSTITKLNNIFK
jgi:thiamine kinase-like enzyme